MIDLEKLEALAKAAQTNIPGHRIKFFMTMDPEIVLALIAEVRALRERWEDQLTLALMNCGVTAAGAQIIFDEIEAIDAARGTEQNTTT
ncbi:hypothetical protein [Burkholderia ubonensis]|uniref:hypothetical protein n=1 Tax=Burkholderia ubonensis TaxID=101571 RepID=UPI00075C67AB|nr:hypothetical protein [Burkholderia ubonensis]KVC81403.1 hypothetical protein WI75_08630 [Burkholderia ubonensis]